MKSPRRQASQVKSWPPCHPTPTRWPGFQLATSAPTASMRPAISCPGTRGYWRPGQYPSFTSMSLWQMPQASTLIRTWLRAGSGMFLSTSSKLPPGLPTWTAFIFNIAASSLIRVDGSTERENNEMWKGTVRTPAPSVEKKWRPAGAKAPTYLVRQTARLKPRPFKPLSMKHALAALLQLSLEGVLGAVAGLGEIAVGPVLHGVGVTVAKLIFHGVVAGLGAFVRLHGAFPTVGIIVKMIADTFRHASLSSACVDKNDNRVRLLRKVAAGNASCCNSCDR